MPVFNPLNVILYIESVREEHKVSLGTATSRTFTVIAPSTNFPQKKEEEISVLKEKKKINSKDMKSMSTDIPYIQTHFGVRLLYFIIFPPKL